MNLGGTRTRTLPPSPQQSEARRLDLCVEEGQEPPETEVLAEQVCISFRTLLVVFLPEFHWPDIRSDENDTPKKWAQWSRKD